MRMVRYAKGRRSDMEKICMVTGWWVEWSWVGFGLCSCSDV